MVRNLIISFFSCVVCLTIARIVFGLTVIPLDQQKQARAVIVVVTPEISIRYSDSKDVVIAEFEIRNPGNKRLVVNAREFNCECYLGDEGSLSVAPGRSETMRLPITAAAIRILPQIKLSLLSNDPETPSVPVTINVTGRPPLVPIGAFSVMQDSSADPK